MASSVRREAWNGALIWLALSGVLFGAGLVCLGVGRVFLSPREVGAVLWSVATGSPVDSMEGTVLLTLRLPRIVLSMLAGAVLATCGGALQGTLRNPLAGPQTIGALSGAGFGGSLALYFSGGPAAVMGLAFLFGILSIAFGLWVARRAGGDAVLGIVLAGIVISALFSALTTLLQYASDTERQLPSLVYWLMGSLANATSTQVWWAGVPMVVCCVLLFALAFRINVLSTGDDEAATLGLDVFRTRATTLVIVAAGCAAVVAVAGVVGWVGLVAPHMARPLAGADHQRLLPASALLGATLLLLVDTICRTAIETEIPLGAATAVIGAPVFIALLGRRAETV
jgi:iron complex transport system permease protein